LGSQRRRIFDILQTQMHTNVPAHYVQAKNCHVPYQVYISLIDQAITCPSDTPYLFHRECSTLNPVVSMNYGKSGLLEIEEKRGNRTLIVHLIPGDVLIMAGMFHDKIKSSEPALTEWETTHDANISRMQGRTLPKRESDVLDKDIETFKLTPETMRMRQRISIEFVPEASPRQPLEAGVEVANPSARMTGWSSELRARPIGLSCGNRLAPSPVSIDPLKDHEEHMTHKMRKMTQRHKRVIDDLTHARDECDAQASLISFLEREKNRFEDELNNKKLECMEEKAAKKRLIAEDVNSVTTSEEIMTRIQELHTQHQQALERLNTRRMKLAIEEMMSAANRCKVCLGDGSHNLVLTPCGHHGLCPKCAEKVMGDGQGHCPFCRKRVEKVFRAYEA